MHSPASLKSCRTRLSPAIRSSLCRSTPQPRTTCRGSVCSAFRRDRSKKNSKRCSSKANEETQQNCDPDGEEEMVRPTSDATGYIRVGSMLSKKGLRSGANSDSCLGGGRRVGDDGAAGPGSA